MFKGRIDRVFKDFPKGSFKNPNSACQSVNVEYLNGEYKNWVPVTIWNNADRRSVVEGDMITIKKFYPRNTTYIDKMTGEKKFKIEVTMDWDFDVKQPLPVSPYNPETFKPTVNLEDAFKTQEVSNTINVTKTAQQVQTPIDVQARDENEPEKLDEWDEL